MARTTKTSTTAVATKLLALHDAPYDNDRADERNVTFERLALDLAKGVLAPVPASVSADAMTLLTRLVEFAEPLTEPGERGWADLQRARRLLARPQAADATTVYVASVGTRHFDFTGYGRTEEEARTALRQAWQDHCRQYRSQGVDVNLWLELQTDISVTAFALGKGYRDGQTIDVQEGV